MLLRRIPPLLLILACCAAPISRAAEKWTQVAAPHFTILTTAGEKVARQWAVELEQFRRTLQLVMAAPDDRVRPVTIVLFRSARAMRPFVPLENGKPKNVGGFFVPVADSQAFALALDSDPAEIRRILFHEAVHWHSAAGDFPLPTWLEEGVAEVYSTFEAKPDGQVTFGRPIQEHLRQLHGSTFDIAVLMRTSRDAVKFNHGDQAQIFYARAWATAHYLFFGRDTPGRDSVFLYLNAAKSKFADQAFQLAFAVDEAEFSKRVAAYLKGGAYQLYRYKVELGDFEARLKAAPANPAEVERALAILLLGTRGAPVPHEVYARLHRAAQSDPALPRVWQALGEAALFDQDLTAAAGYFDKAVAAGSDSYYAHYGLGMARLHGQDEMAGMFSPAEAARAAADFRRAIALNPRYIPAYESLAGLISVLDGYDPADQAALERAHQLAPASVMVRIGLALCDLRAGRGDLGRAALQALVDGPVMQGRERQFATEMLREEKWKSSFAEIEKAFERREYAQALELIAQANGEFTTARHRQALEQNRRIAAASLKVSRAIDLLNAGDHRSARVLLQEILDSDAGSFEKAEARRLLAAIPAE